MPEKPEEQYPRSTVIVPAHIWEAIGKIPNLPLTLVNEIERADAENEQSKSSPIRDDLIRNLAKADGNISWAMAEFTLAVMYGEMADNLLSQYTITRKDDE